MLLGFFFERGGGDRKQNLLCPFRDRFNSVVATEMCNILVQPHLLSGLDPFLQRIKKGQGLSGKWAWLHCEILHKGCNSGIIVDVKKLDKSKEEPL